jgi:predicted nucleic acid-binding Zn ribbon protein
MKRALTVQDVRRMDEAAQEELRRQRVRLQSQQRYEQQFRSGRAYMPVPPVTPLSIPKDVRRVSSSSPCPMCATRAGLPCRHRPYEGTD